MSDGQFLVLTTKTRQEWLAQAREALDRLERAGITIEGVTSGTFDDALAKDRPAVADLLQAFDALGARIADDLFERAGLRRGLSLVDLS